MRGTNALIVLTALTVAGGCAGGSSPTTTSSAAPPPARTSAPPVTEAKQATATTRAPSGAATGWSTTPITVTHTPPVPPVPVITGIRYAAHRDGFDRIVLDIPGALPGYSAKYVTEVRRDGSGDPVSMPGEAFLLIVLNPAQAHRADGTATVTGIHRTGLAGIQAYAVVGDYEGYVSIALGVSGVRKYHIGELSNRIYIDVAV
ncbi:hypothetical protein ACIA5D_18485 [Actinoplanes sp. NPDC051513]|uniref:AMIN-like domain-containing (lipo)protein n=1 Tax=Actinoplanes sp. NPDC051513 TaxID=3363908 RepID=UPI0037B0CC31